MSRSYRLPATKALNPLAAEDSRELAADRLLILSGFADTPAVPARDIRKHLAASHQFRANCLAMNDLAAALCGSVGA